MSEATKPSPQLNAEERAYLQRAKSEPWPGVLLGLVVTALAAFTFSALWVVPAGFAVIASLVGLDWYAYRRLEEALRRRAERRATGHPVSGSLPSAALMSPSMLALCFVLGAVLAGAGALLDGTGAVICLVAGALLLMLAIVDAVGSGTLRRTPSTTPER